MADDELWHVRISADEVKQLTLEQIDDLYRLDVIDADTQLWQDGMDEWLPLRVVAGLDEEEVVSVSIPPTVPPSRLATTNASWPPAPSAPQSFLPAPPSTRPAISRPPPAPIAEAVPSRPPPPSTRPAISRPPPAALAETVPSRPPSPAMRPPISRPPPAPLADTATSWPPASPFGLSPSYAPPAGGSIRPQMVSPVPFAYPKPTNPMPIVLAAIVGVVVTLYRNDMLHAGARTVGQETTYLRLESALGGPSFGTPRYVESMAKAAAALPDIAPLPAPASTSKSDSSSDSSDSKPTSTAAPIAKSPPASPPEARKVVAPQPQSASRAAPTRPVAAEVPDPVFKQPKGAKKAKGNEFDPLNGNL
jgi:hypothetical protein